MLIPKQWWWIWLALFLSASPGWAASVAKEQRAYETALLAFHDGLWPLAELDFVQFAQKYPDSKRLVEAGLFQAQAMIKQGKYGPAETFLTGPRRPVMGPFTNDYNYWLGEAQFQNGDYQAAAITLASLSADSAQALAATVEAGSALARMGEWTRVTSLLKSRTALMEAAAATDPDNELVLRSRLLLAQANFAGRDYGAAGQLLATIKPATLSPDLEWQRLYLWCQVQLAEGDREAALRSAVELVEAARRVGGSLAASRLAASVALQSRVLEETGRGAEAMVVLQANLASNAPPELQREAILKIAALAIAQQQFTNAEGLLTIYCTRFTNSPALDAAWLTLGELDLQDYACQPALTNRLMEARTHFDQLLTNFPNSLFTGKAYLDQGWCDWLAGNLEASQAEFQKATLKLPPSEDLAVARFKLADALFARGDYADALINYQAVLWHFTNDFPRVAEFLGGLALYQSFRAQLELGELAGAEDTMHRLVTAYPQNELNETNALLLGQKYTDLRDPANALTVFKQFKNEMPHSTLLPSVDLAMARAYEEAQQWPEALAQYDHWLQTWPTNELLPQARYSQAWANYQAGNSTNALLLFTNFVAQFPQNDLAPTAQMWVADYFFGLGDWADAERNYEAIFQNTNWQSSPLNYPAQMMAGRAAVARTDYPGAIRDYFEKLEADTNCPIDLRVQATFAHGSALMKMESADTNDPTANFRKAVTIFNTICTIYPTNELGARAWGEMGDCYLQLTNYDSATNAFTQAGNAAGTNVAISSQARIGLGLVLEKQAALLPAGEGRKMLYYQALGNYLEVFNATPAERDPFWTKKAGLQAADLAEELGEWQEAIKLYASLATELPQLKESLAKKAAVAGQHLNGSDPQGH